MVKNFNKKAKNYEKTICAAIFYTGILSDLAACCQLY